MPRLDFDFHARPARYSRSGLALLVAGGVALVWALLSWQQTRATVEGLGLQVAALQNVQSEPETRPASRAEDATLKAQHEIAAQLRYSWQPAFDALANAHTRNVALVSLDANQAKAQLKLVAETRQLADAIAFLGALEGQPGVARAELLQHEVQRDAKEKPVRFTALVELHATGPSR